MSPDQPNPDPLDRSLHRHLGDDAPPETHARADAHFRDLASALRTRASADSSTSDSARSSTSAFPSARRPLLWLWSGLGLAGGAALTLLTLALLVSPAPTWADVAARFRTLRFFNATVFFTETAGQPPEKIELWVAQDHQLRAHYRGLIFFGSEGKISQVLSSDSGEEIPLETLRLSLSRSTGATAFSSRDSDARDPYPALALVRGIVRLGEMSEFSLDNLLLLFRGKREGLQPTANTDDTLAGDLQVFDFGSSRAPEWMRLWVLKKSELPLRLRVWNPTNGGQTELLFDYATAMPADAFDAAQVQAGIREKQGAANRLYSLLRDSGGRPLTPEQLFAARGGYRLPDIDGVGRTPEGVVWVLSRNVENHRADGRRAYGWDRLSDDAGQTYTRRTIGWMAEDDVLLEYFVPTNLDSGFKLPRAYTLVCTDRPRDDDDVAAGAIKDIGTRTVTAWRETVSIPDLLKAQQNQIAGRTHWQLLALDEAADRQDWSRFDEIASAIPGAPESEPAALARDLKVAHKLILNRQRETAAILCAHLYPLVVDGVRAGDPLRGNIVRWHIADLFRGGRRDAARQLANRHAADALRHSKIEGPRFVVDLLLELRLAGLKESDVPRFFDADVIGRFPAQHPLEDRAPLPPAPLQPREIPLASRS